MIRIRKYRSQLLFLTTEHAIFVRTLADIGLGTRNAAACWGARVAMVPVGEQGGSGARIALLNAATQQIVKRGQGWRLDDEKGFHPSHPDRE